MEHTTVPQICLSRYLLPIADRPGPTPLGALPAQFVLLISHSRDGNVMQCKEICYTIPQGYVKVNSDVNAFVKASVSFQSETFSGNCRSKSVFQSQLAALTSRLPQTSTFDDDSLPLIYLQNNPEQ